MYGNTSSASFANGPEDLKPIMQADRSGQGRMEEQQGHVIEIPSVFEIVKSLQPSSFTTLKQHVEDLKRFANTFDVLMSFCGLRLLKLN